MESSPYIQIVVVALFAAFLLLRLRSILGRRPDDEDDASSRRGESLKSGQASGRGDVVGFPTRLSKADDPVIDATMGGTLTRLRLADPSFSTDQFIAGARAAFQMVLNAFAGGDRQTLESLLSPDVYRNFDGVIKSREEAGEVMESELVAFKAVALDDARLEGNEAYISIKFVTDQVNVLRDRDGAVIEGDPDRIETLTNIWTFRRDVTSDDPNWELMATRTVDEEKQGDDNE